jgi:hypothetical protein
MDFKLASIDLSQVCRKPKAPTPSSTRFDVHKIDRHSGSLGFVITPYFLRCLRDLCRLVFIIKKTRPSLTGTLHHFSKFIREARKDTCVG